MQWHTVTVEWGIFTPSAFTSYLSSKGHILLAFSSDMLSSPVLSASLAACIHFSKASLCATFDRSQASVGTHPSEFVSKARMSHSFNFCTVSKSSYCFLCSTNSSSVGTYGHEPANPSSFQALETSINSCRTAAALSLHEV